MGDKIEPTNYLKLTNEKLDSELILQNGALVGGWTSLIGLLALYVADGTDHLAVSAIKFSAAAFAVTTGVAKLLKDRQRTKAIQAKLILISREAFQTDGAAVNHRSFLSGEILDLAENSGFFAPKLPKPKAQPIAGMGHTI